MIEIYVTFVVIAIISFYVHIYSKKKNIYSEFPPGPPALPYFGNVLSLISKPYIQFSKWATQYGKLYTMHSPNSPALVINDEKLIRELFGKLAATGRVKTEMMGLLTNGYYGLGQGEGVAWMEQKQHAMKALKYLGEGPSWEAKINKEVERLCNEINEEQSIKGQVFFKRKLKYSVLSPLLSIITGDKLDANSKEPTMMEKYATDLQTAAGLIVFPWIRHFAPVLSGYKRCKENCEELRAHVENRFREHVYSRKSGEPPRDMIDAFLEKMENCEDPSSSFYGEEGRKHGIGSIVGLLVGSDQTLAHHLHWMILHLAVNQQVQQELQQEIDLVLGGNRDPCSGDRSKIPYMEAVILETLRVTSILPFGGLHELLEDITFQGYHLPKGLHLIANIYYVHNDKTIWGDPENFRPRRFLEGNLGLRENVLSFIPGKRSCPGERLARDTMFLFATKLVQKYSFSVDINVENITEYLEPDIGYMLVPKNNGVVCTQRR